MRLSLLPLLFSPALFAQMVLEGNVTDSANHAPVAGATVAVNVGQTKPLIAATDASGHFRLSVTLPTYSSLQVGRAGYLNYSGAVPVKGERPATLNIELTREAVIFGKLEDEDGFPVAGARVDAYTAGTPPQRRAMASSDDRGEYRVANLPAGRYYVRASSPALSQWDKSYWAEYFPGTLEPGETGLIELSAGQERGGVDIHFTKHEGVTIAGSIIMPAGAAPARPLTLSLRSKDQGNFSFTTLQQGAQTFSVPHVAPGSYIVQVQSGNPQTQAGDLLGEQQVEVGGSDVRDIVIQVRAIEPVDLQGTVVSEGGPLPRAVVGLRSTFGPVKSVHTNEDGSFAFKDLLPGHYQVMLSPEIPSANLPSIVPVYFLSARLGDKDVMRDGFDLNGAPPAALRIGVTSARGIVTCKLLDPSGRPVAGGRILLAAKEGNYRTGAVSDANGVFILAAPPGDYRIFTVAEGDQYAPINSSEYLKTHDNDFPPVRIVEGENPPLTLRLPVAR